jgi:hypothetical protein
MNTGNVLLSAAVLAAIGLGADSAAAATLIGQTIDASINITGEDDNGFYTLPVLTGPITLSGPGDFVQTITVFKQLTEDGFSTPTNQINGDVLVDISANAISVTMQGQVQPFELESVFSGISGPIVGDADSASGLISGVNLELFNTFTPSSVDFATFYLGFQPGTNVTQTETLTFGAISSPAPEPAAWAMMLLGFGGLGAALRGSRSRATASA